MYSESLSAVIFNVLKNPDATKDVLQEVIIKIWYSGSSYNPGKGRLFTWMLNLTRNYAIDVLRSKRYRNSKKNKSIDDFEYLIDWRTTITYNPDTVLLREMVSKLKPELTILLELVYFKGYTHTEAADELNLPLGTVKTRIRKALAQLRSQFN